MLEWALDHQRIKHLSVLQLEELVEKHVAMYDYLQWYKEILGEELEQYWQERVSTREWSLGSLPDDYLQDFEDCEQVLLTIMAAYDDRIAEIQVEEEILNEMDQDPMWD